MNDQARPPANRASLFWISVLALFTAAFANAARVGASGAIKAELFDPHDAQHSGELIGAALGNSFLGFALSLLVISPLLDKIGVKRTILFASLCFIAGPALILFAASSADYGTMSTLLNLGMVLSGFAWGATEGSINPLCTTLLSRRQDRQAQQPACLVAGRPDHRRRHQPAADQQRYCRLAPADRSGHGSRHHLRPVGDAPRFSADRKHRARRELRRDDRRSLQAHQLLGFLRDHALHRCHRTRAGCMGRCCTHQSGGHEGHLGADLCFGADVRDAAFCRSA